MKKFMIMMLFAAFVGNMCFSAVANDESRMAELISQRDILREDLNQIASEKARCERQKRNWRTATIVGGVGVAATATGAVIQHGRNQGQDTKLKAAESERDKQQTALETAKR